MTDVITCAKFQHDVFRGYDFTLGRNLNFPVDNVSSDSNLLCLYCADRI